MVRTVLIMAFVWSWLLSSTAISDPLIGADLLGGTQPQPNVPAPTLQPKPSAVDISLPDLSAYEPEVQKLLETTYLGHREEFPDAGEPAVVLQKYLEQNAHGYHEQLAKQGRQLNSELAAWQTFVQQYPQSRHALVGLAEHYRTKARVSGDAEYTRRAANHYIRAAEIGLAHGRIRYVWELSDLLVELGDKAGLDQVFGRVLAKPKDMDPGYYHDALVAYAHGLARLKDYDRAGGYFEEALNLNPGHPESSIGAINLYAEHLLDQGQARNALEVLNRLTPEIRQRFFVSTFLRKEAMKRVGMDPTSALQEVNMIKQRLSNAEGIRFIPKSEFDSKYEFIPVPRAGPLVLGYVRLILPRIGRSSASPNSSLASLLSLFGTSSAEAQQTFQHIGSDDCRTHDSTPVECFFDPSIGGYVCYQARLCCTKISANSLFPLLSQTRPRGDSC